MSSNHVETVIIGGGQTGLNAGYHLAKRGRPFVILDANERVGDAWRNRWDSLRLFTPALFSRLPGKRLHMSNWSFPTKDELADYLESYAPHFELPVRTGVEVDRLEKADGRFVVSAGDELLRGRERDRRHRRAPHSEDVPPSPPSSIRGSCSSIRPTTAIRRSSRTGDVLLVGAGNSGAELAVELRAHAPRPARRPEARRDPGQARHAVAAGSASASSASSGTAC